MEPSARSSAFFGRCAGSKHFAEDRVPDDTNFAAGVFVHETQTGLTSGSTSHVAAVHADTRADPAAGLVHAAGDIGQPLSA